MTELNPIGSVSFLFRIFSHYSHVFIVLYVTGSAWRNLEFLYEDLDFSKLKGKHFSSNHFIEGGSQARSSETEFSKFLPSCWDLELMQTHQLNLDLLVAMYCT